MQDIPMFTTEFGAASLALKEIPYRQEAYIRLLATEQPEALLQECLGFCRACGAEKVYATGHEGLAPYPVHTRVLEMRGQPRIDPEMLESLFPVTEQTVRRWRELYNDRMQGVDNAATLEQRDEEKLLGSTGAYFVHHQGQLLGLGWIEEERLLALASLVPGAGARVAATLLSLLEGERVSLEVASTNERAIRLYEKLGFSPVREVSCWHRIL